MAMNIRLSLADATGRNLHSPQIRSLHSNCMTSVRIYKAQGIILARKNVGEADRVLTVFTNEYGKVRVIAKGIRRINSRRSPHLEVFNHVGLMIRHGKAMDSVTEAETIESFPAIRCDLG